MTTDSKHDAKPRTDRNAEGVSRRRMLLTGTALAAFGLSGGAAVTQAQPKSPQPAAPSQLVGPGVGEAARSGCRSAMR